MTIDEKLNEIHGAFTLCSLQCKHGTHLSEEMKAQIKQAFSDIIAEIIGEDEKQIYGKLMDDFKYPTPKIRNKLRQEIRERLREEGIIK